MPTFVPIIVGKAFSKHPFHSLGCIALCIITAIGMLFPVFSTQAAQTNAAIHAKTIQPMTMMTTLPPIPLDSSLMNDSRSFGLGTSAEYWFDKSRSYSVKRVAQDTSLRFVRGTDAVLNFGYPEATVWVRFRVSAETLRNSALFSDSLRRMLHQQPFWILSTGARFTDTAVITIMSTTGTILATDTAGYSIPYKRWRVKTHHIAFVFPTELLEQHGEVYVYLQQCAHRYEFCKLKLLSNETFLSLAGSIHYENFFYYGLVCFGVFYNVLLFIMLRDRFYALYIAQLVVGAIGYSIVYGTLYQMIPLPGGGVHSQLYYLSLSIAYFIRILFIYTFLKEHSALPRSFQYVLFALMGLALAIGCFELVHLRKIANILFIFEAVIGNLLIIILSGAAWYKGYTSARYLFWGQAAAEGGFIINILSASVFQSYSIAYHSITVGNSLEMILFAFALADRFSLIQEQRREAESRALQGEIYRLRHEELSGAYEEITKQQDVLLQQQHLIQEKNIALEHTNEELSQTVHTLQTTQEQLVQAEKMISMNTLVIGVAHELNTPLGVVVTASSGLERRVKEFKYQINSQSLKRSMLQEFVDAAEQGITLIARSVERMSTLTEKFRQLSGKQYGEELRSLHLYEMLRTQLPLHVRELFANTHHALRIEATEAAQNLHINTYPNILVQIFVELITNAIKHGFTGYTEHGVVTVRLGTVPEEITPNSHAEALRVDVHNNGRTIPPKNISRILDPFFTTSSGTGGAGLGLSTVYNLMHEKIGGSIECASTVEHGTTITLTFPIR